ncbi:hypothetical protein J659_4121 [Acinetobacter baumannii 1406589]|nr:hypothetical protein J659_4121 [Acinetobacter baumannii 1406589]
MKSLLIKTLLISSLIMLSGCSGSPPDGNFISKAYNFFFASGYIILLGVFIKPIRGAALGFGILLLIAAYLAWVIMTTMFPDMNLVITLPYNWLKP